jgi:hypothetical protein
MRKVSAIAPLDGFVALIAFGSAYRARGPFDFAQGGRPRSVLFAPPYAAAVFSNSNHTNRTAAALRCFCCGFGFSIVIAFTA